MSFLTLLIAGGLIWFFAGRHIGVLRDRLTRAESAIAELKLKLQHVDGTAPALEGEPPIAEPQTVEEEPPSETAVPIVPTTPEPRSAAPVVATAAPPTASFEERIGTRWAVWVGGAALAVGGIFLVNYSIEAGLIGPTTRVALGALFALALISAGEWMRRGERTLPVDIIPSAHIPSILTAAGTVVLFGTIYAAYALYGLIGPAAAFVLLGAAGLGSMVASALHGPALAGIGLLGAMATPLLVSSDAPNPWPLVLYLAIVGASAFALARLRRWLWLALASVGGAVLWGFAIVLQTGDDWTWAAYAHALIQLALTALFIAIDPHLPTPDSRARPDGIAAGTLGALTLLVVGVLGATAGTSAEGWLPFAAFAIVLLAGTAWVVASSAAAAVFSGVVVFAVALLWQDVNAPPPASNLWPAVGDILRLPAEVHAYFTFLAFASLGVALTAGQRLRVGRDLPGETAGIYALAATLTPLAALVVAYLRVTQFDRSIPFALIGVVLAALFSYAADHMQKSEGDPPAAAPHIGAGAFAAAAIAALSFALVASLDRGYLTVAFALTALGTSYVSTLKRIPLLRYAVAALGVVVLGRIAWDPAIMGTDVGRWPILNWLLIGYGVPAVCFALSAKLLRMQDEDFAVRIAEVLAVLFSALLVFFQIRHLVHGGDPLTPGSSFLEQGLLTFASLAFAAAMLKLDSGDGNPVFRAASYLFGFFSFLFAVVGLVFVENPYFTSGEVTGGWFFNDLLPAYFLPSLMALYLARISRGVRPHWYTIGAAALAFVLAFCFVTLSVRHLFHGPLLGAEFGTTDAEQWSYSVAWLALGLLFLAYGIWRGSPEARLASGALVLLSTLKVFLFDLSGVAGLWRALSFICLGLVLIGIGLAYQRLLFSKPRPRVPEPDPLA